MSKADKLWRKKNPWCGSFYNARSRCTDNSHKRYRYYGGKGVKFLLTLEDMKKLWKRDNADKLKWASIDRIDQNGHYEFDNCRFIEHSENCAGLKRVVERRCPNCSKVFRPKKSKTIFCCIRCSNVHKGKTGQNNWRR